MASARKRPRRGTGSGNSGHFTARPVDIASLFSKRDFSENERFELCVPAECIPLPLDRVIRESFAALSWARCRSLIESGKVTVNGELALDGRSLIGPSSVVCVDPKAKRLQNRLAASITVLYWDSQLVIVNKPSGISTVPFDESEKGTLDELTRRVLGQLTGDRLPPLGVVHRIDKETSGVVAFARTTAAKRHLKQQFRFHTNHRAYLALAMGSVCSGRIESRIVEDRGDGRRGGTEHPTLGQNAITHVELVERLQGASLIRCELETGRTHQIRIHLAENGHPLLGERVYGTNEVCSASLAPRLMLHAAELGITHPIRDEFMTFRCDPPPDFATLLERLRKS